MLFSAQLGSASFIPSRSIIHAADDLGSGKKEKKDRKILAWKLASIRLVAKARVGLLISESLIVIYMERPVKIIMPRSGAEVKSGKCYLPLNEKLEPISSC